MAMSCWLSESVMLGLRVEGAGHIVRLGDKVQRGGTRLGEEGELTLVEMGE